jgi:hypothetical protein
MKSNPNSPLAKANRPLPHEIEGFLIEMIYPQTDDPDVTSPLSKKVINWLKELAK